MRYQGRNIDPVAVWGDYVQFPSNMDASEGGFLPLVVCPNPEHTSSKRHFQVNAEKPLVHCFAGCGISGTYEHAIAMIEDCTHRQARRIILKHSRIGKSVVRKKTHVRKEARPEDLEYERYLPQVALDYMTSRGFSYTTMSNWNLGWDANELRIVIPACDSRGRVKLLIKRTVKPRVEPRYLYTKGTEKDRLLFGLDKIDLGLIRSSGIVLVEGSLDVMMCHQHGFRNSGGLLTSKMSEFQARLIAGLRPKRITTMFDADVAGIEATISTRERLPRLPMFVCRFPAGKTDPATLTKEEMERAIARAISFAEFRKLTGNIVRSKRKEIHVG
jgi:DNA primase